MYMARAFPPPGTARAAMVDMGSEAVAYVTPRGTKTAVVPADYAWTVVHAPTVSMNHEDANASPDVATMHQSADVELPLLTRAEAELTSDDQFATPLPPPHPLALGAQQVGTTPASTTHGSDP
ncbi:hypothetical protein PHYPSEUDO_013937 [Phytophthora pseudosyringae]|uniref:Uncharacterized protein n=1 Tax=Phytophthora pseudosyringae TaxID=221518 RepID=A0A8T1V818_9STRA|nr:hypothetical protein PHYPSEUDO_013937 [Phytophthora pseudosyringae]